MNDEMVQDIVDKCDSISKADSECWADSVKKYAIVYIIIITEKNLNTIMERNEIPNYGRTMNT